MPAAQPEDLMASSERSWYDRQPLLTCSVEVLVLAVLAPAAACWFGKPQPMQALMPLLVLLPLLFGLRYGFFAGVAAALGLGAVLLLALTYRPLVVPVFPKVLAVGLLTVGAMAGQFRDRWAAQLRQTRAQSQQHASRFAQFAHGYALLQHSHGQLEQQLAGGSVSLRSLMARLRQQMPLQSAQAALPLAGLAQQMLDLLADAGSFQSAALYEINELGQPSPIALASLGQMPALSASHPMLCEALRSGQVLSVREAGAGMDGVQHTELLAMVPLTDASGHVHAVVAVGAMPFMAIHQNTFDVVGLLARQLGDMLTSHVVVMDEKKGVAGMRRQLAQNLRDALDAGLQVSVATCRVSGAEGAALQQAVRLCLAQGRATDRAWLCRDRHGRPVIIKSMALVGARAAGNHLERLTAAMPVDVVLHTQAWELVPGQRMTSVLDQLCSACELSVPKRRLRLQPGRVLRYTALLGNEVARTLARALDCARDRTGMRTLNRTPGTNARAKLQVVLKRRSDPLAQGGWSVVGGQVGTAGAAAAAGGAEQAGAAPMSGAVDTAGSSGLPDLSGMSGNPGIKEMRGMSGNLGVTGMAGNRAGNDASGPASVVRASDSAAGQDLQVERAS